jgi:hypothetical protein
MNEHSLHLYVGNKISTYFGDAVVRDTACGGTHRLPLIYDRPKKRETTFCNVDMLIYRDTVKVIFEIEEADIKPTQVFGKFLTSALSRFYEYKGVNKALDKSLLFIQVLDNIKLKPKTKKFRQFEYLSRAVNRRLTLQDKTIYYRLFSMRAGDERSMNEIIKAVESFLKK